ncbi:hypothetical protein [Halovivax sp.]|uniref:hypothetical protein n=1 Tax=Halovivax sp. TaxID=1935978 RepID=UPI0031B8B2B6
MKRRDVLRSAGLTTVAIGLVPTGAAAADARTVGGGRIEGDEHLPGYERWLALEEGALAFDYVDWAALEAFVATELEEAQPGEEVPAEFAADPMIAPVSEGLIAAYFFVGLELARFGLGRLLDDDGPFASEVEELVQVGDAFVVTGAIDREELDAELTAEAVADFQTQLERTGERGGFDLYESLEGEDEAAIAVGDDAIAVVDGAELEADVDPTAIVERTVDVAAGDVARATDESEAVAWLLESAGDGDVAVGQYGGPFDPEELRHPALEAIADAEGYVSSFTVEDEETLRGDFAAILPGADEDELAELVGASAAERTIDVDGDRVTATGEWREEVRYE